MRTLALALALLPSAPALAAPPDAPLAPTAQPDQFPHPTYRGGENEGYRAFGNILLLFLEQGDNFDYLASHHLFDASLSYIFPSGDGDSWSLRELVTVFSSDEARVDEPTRDGLEQMEARIDDAG